MSCQRHDVPCAFGARISSIEEMQSCQRHDVPCAFGARISNIEDMRSCQRHDVLEFVGYTDAELVVDIIKVATETDIGGKVLVKVITHRCPY